MYNFGHEARSIVLNGPPWEPSVGVLASCANRDQVQIIVGALIGMA